MVEFVLFVIGAFVLGHFIGAFGLYFTHRFVFHGKLGNTWPLKFLKKLHLMHHKHYNDEHKDDFILVPAWARLALTSALLLFICLVSIPVGLGILSFAVLYMKRHWDIHHGDTESIFYHHHNLHHRQANVNHSGIYPFIDYIFGTGKSW